MFKMSQAVLLAFHAMAELSKTQGNLQTTKEIATRLNISADHLAKVMQRLNRAGLVNSTRGPSGGFCLAVDADKITMQQIYTAIEGNVKTHSCPLETRRCGGGSCIFGTMLADVGTAVSDYLNNTTLAEAARKYIAAPSR